VLAASTTQAIVTHDHRVTLELIFRDIFYRLRAFAGGHDLFLKLEGFSVTGSIKIKTAIALVEDLEKRGVAKAGETVFVESSSGNLGLALSLVCAIKGYEFICVTDPNATRSAVKSIELYGAQVIVVTNTTAPADTSEAGSRGSTKYYGPIRTPAGSINMRIRPTRTFTPRKRRPRSPRNSIRSIGYLSDQEPPARWGASASGFIKNTRNVRVVAVEPVGSVTFGGPPGKRKIPGIGTSVRPPLADLAKPDRIVSISEERTVASCLSFVRDHHLLIGGSTGTVLAAVQQFAPEFDPGDTIVAISADLGEKYLDTVYDPEWVARFITAEDESRLEPARSRKLSVVPRTRAARAVKHA
jgi:cysteine synthase A